jgi:hypothetical protein
MSKEKEERKEDEQEKDVSTFNNNPTFSYIIIKPS